MRLYIDAGNSRLKWFVDDQGQTVASGVGSLDSEHPVVGIGPLAEQIGAIVISTVASEEKQWQLASSLGGLCPAPVHFYWAEFARGGLVSAYQDTSKMGADRWHGMYGAWLNHKRGFAVVDAGSAVTVDYVDSHGQHLGGYILPGLRMMLRSLRTDAARIWFDPEQVLSTGPGKSTGECVNHGLAWLSAAMTERIRSDAKTFGLADVLVTGGDADRLIGLGLPGIHRPDLVLQGLHAIDVEESGS